MSSETWLKSWFVVPLNAGHFIWHFFLSFYGSLAERKDVFFLVEACETTQRGPAELHSDSCRAFRDSHIFCRPATFD